MVENERQDSLSANGDEGLNADGINDAEDYQTAENELVDVKCVLLDIEGTICPISFVKETLFPYALKALPNVLASKWDDEEFKPYKDAFPEEARSSPATLQAYVEQLTREDRKDACHKNLQGYLWKDGYKTGAYSTPLFPDVAPRLKDWKDAGLRLAIYSSGSVFAQKLLFAHVQINPPNIVQEVKGSKKDADVGARATAPVAGEKRSIDESTSAESTTEQPPLKKAATGVNGDEMAAAEVAGEDGPATENLQYLISDWFDTTNAGPKKEAESYTHIAETLGLKPAEILFLTDSPDEYDASDYAGYKVGLIRRPGNPPVEEIGSRPRMMYSLHNAHPFREEYGIAKPQRAGRRGSGAPEFREG